jgi:hypothetical protein
MNTEMFENELVEAGLAVFETLTDHVAKKTLSKIIQKTRSIHLKKMFLKNLINQTEKISWKH